MKQRTLPLSILTVSLLGGVGSASAGLILQPISATTNMGASQSTDIDHVRDQSGLSVGYADGVDDFDAYLLSDPTHDTGGAANTWVSGFGVLTGNVDFDLGGLFNIESIAMWNRGNNAPNNIIGFNLLVDDNAAFSSPTTVISGGVADPDLGLGTAVSAQQFNFTSITASHVRLQITSNNGSPQFTVLGEVAFEGTAAEPVPEPSSFALLCLGGVGLLTARIRRRHSKS